VEKLLRSIARPFLCKNCFGRSSKVFHKWRANFPQVFPQAISNLVPSKLILPTLGRGGGAVCLQLIGRWLHLSWSAHDYLGVGKRHCRVLRCLSVYPCPNHWFCFPSSLKLTSCTILKNGQDARSTKSRFSCGVGILPAHEKIIENGARSQFKLTFAADNINSIAQLTQSLSQIRVSVPQLSNFFATVKHSRVIFATEYFANFRQTQTSMLPN